MRCRKKLNFVLLCCVLVCLKLILFNQEDPKPETQNRPRIINDFAFKLNEDVIELNALRTTSTGIKRTNKEDLAVYGRNVNPNETLFKNGNTRLILWWRHPWGVETEGVKEGAKVDNCTFTYNKERIATASAVIFHYSALDNEKMPWRHYRHPDQRYVFLTAESPNYVKNVENRNLSVFDGGFINWTMSYHLKSDVFSPYFTADDDLTANGRSVVDGLVKQKSKLILWVVSNCDLLSGSLARMKYALQLAQAGLDVHFYGACFNNTDEFNKLSRSQLDSFKFYLSFENTVHCEDYVTEKFWGNGLLSGRIPIVFGPSKENMERLAPPGSYIHTEDFKSPGHLAEYLSKLDKNETAYRRYFDWRVNPDHQTLKILAKYDRVREKRLCDMLQNDIYRRKSYRSIAQFVYVSEPDVCLKHKD